MNKGFAENPSWKLLLKNFKFLSAFAVVTLSPSKGLSHFENLSVTMLLAIMFISYFFLFVLVIFRNKSQKRHDFKIFWGCTQKNLANG